MTTVVKFYVPYQVLTQLQLQITIDFQLASTVECNKRKPMLTMCDVNLIV